MKLKRPKILDKLFKKKKQPKFNVKRLIALGAIFVTVLTVLLTNTHTITGGDDGVNKGIEFAGGIEMLVEVSEDEDGDKIVDEEALIDIASILGQRIDGAGVKNPIIEVEYVEERSSNIRVTVAGLAAVHEAEEMVDLITAPGAITFRDVNDAMLATGDQLLSGASLGYQNGEPVVSLKVKDTELMGSITQRLSNEAAGENMMVVWIDYPENDSTSDWSYAKYEELNSDGTCLYPHKQTDDERKLCNAVISAASVTEQLTGDVIISGSFDADEARELAAFINSGSFTYHMNVASSSIIESTYGNEAFGKAVIASIIALTVVSVFMIFAYGILGIIGVILLLIYALASIATFNWLGGEYGPDTIAALVIGFGMAVDASIILFERMKDELKKGKSLGDSFDDGNRKSLSSILDANITTFIAAFVLFQFGSRTVKGFSIMLTISIIWTVLIIVLLGRLVIANVIKSRLIKKNKVTLGFRGKAQDKFANINFMKHAKKALVASFAILLVGGALMLTIKPKQSLEFTGGANIVIATEFEDREDTDAIQDELDDYATKIANEFDIVFSDISYRWTPDVDGTTEDEGIYTLQLKTQSEFDSEMLEEIEDYVLDINDDYEVTGSFITPAVAQTTVNNAVQSLLWASLAIIGYVSIRFKWTYALGAVVAIIHDALIVLALFTIFRLEVSLPFVSAILAIIGYSINDTVVQFDRIREGVNENSKLRLNKQELTTIANEAIKSTVVRSILTTVTTLLAVISLLVFGPEASITFNMAMLFGLVVGTYSSIFIATRIWIQLETFRQKRIKDKKVVRNQIPGEPDEHIFPGIND